MYSLKPYSFQNSFLENAQWIFKIRILEWLQQNIANFVFLYMIKQSCKFLQPFFTMNTFQYISIQYMIQLVSHFIIIIILLLNTLLIIRINKDSIKNLRKILIILMFILWFSTNSNKILSELFSFFNFNFLITF